jgi:geranylgeranyl reductase family protein
MQTREYEVIIVGGGPAGSSAATALGKAGKKVLLIDKGRFPREKTCGDGMTFKCIPTLKKLGVEGDFTAQSVRSSGYRIIFTDGAEVSVRKQLPDEQAVVYLMPRFVFDNLLMQHTRSFSSVHVAEDTLATRAVMEGDRVIGVETAPNGKSATSVYASLVIDASGVDSKIVAQLNGAPRSFEDYALTVRGYFDDIDGLDDLVEFVFDERILPGYFWIFPIGPRAANVGCGTFQHIVIQQDVNLRKLFMDFINDHPAGRKLKSATLRGPLKGGKIPLGFDQHSRVRNGIIFCGDAAGFCDPLTAEGISFALESGMMAGEIAAQALSANNVGQDFLSRYDAGWQAAFGGRFTKADFARQPVDKSYFLNYAIDALANHPALDEAAQEVGAQYQMMFKLKALLKAL